MTTVPIGHSEHGAVGVDLDHLIGSHACIVANSGGGKSGLLRKLLEQSHGEVQHIVLDIEDEFYTLRERFDYVIAGGEGGDAPATLENAESLARAALEHGFSLIVQMNDLGGNAPEFVRRFLGGLMSAPRELWRPLLIPVDEVQRFAPSGAGTEASAAVKDLLQRGRKRGFTAVLASLRISEIDPGVRGLCNNWLLGRVGQSLDRRTMADQLGFTAAEGRDKLRALEPRHFWGFGPAIAAEPVLFRVDDVETTPVKPGQAKVATPPAPDALREILGGLATASESNDDVAESLGGAVTPSLEDVAKLYETITSLRTEVTRLGSQMSEERAAGRRAGIAIGIARARNAIDALRIPDIEGTIAGSAGGEVMPAATSRSEAARGARSAAGSGAGPTTKDASPATAGGASAPSPAALAIADLLDRVNPAKLTWAQAATMTGRKASGGNFNSARKWLRESGRIVEEGDFIQSAADAPAGMSRDEAIDLWKSVLTNPAPRMIDALLVEPLTKEGIGLAIGAQPRGGNFNNGLAQLRRNGLIYEYGSGTIKLAEPLPGEA